jgi:hypothetical protein
VQLELGAVSLDGHPGPHQLHQLADERRVHDRVVRRPIPQLRDLASDRLGAGPCEAERELVELLDAALEDDLDDRDRQLRRTLADRRRLDHARLQDTAAPGVEPLLPREKLDELGAPERRRRDHRSCSQ